jgi:hypothetical protein
VKHLWIGGLLVACSSVREPTLDTKYTRHVIVAVEQSEYADSCMVPCARMLRPGEHIARCGLQGASWDFESRTKPPAGPEPYDIAPRLGRASSFAVCAMAGDTK